MDQRHVSHGDDHAVAVDRFEEGPGRQDSPTSTVGGWLQQVFHCEMAGRRPDCFGAVMHYDALGARRKVVKNLQQHRPLPQVNGGTRHERQQGFITVKFQHAAAFAGGQNDGGDSCRWPGGDHCRPPPCFSAACGRRSRGTARSFRAVGLFAQFLTIASHRGIMFFETGRKLMGTVQVADEIDIGDIGRVQDRQDGFSSGVTDGTRRKTDDLIGVVNTGALQMTVGDRTGEIGQIIDCGGITLQAACVA